MEQKTAEQAGEWSTKIKDLMGKTVSEAYAWGLKADALRALDALKEKIKTEQE